MGAPERARDLFQTDQMPFVDFTTTLVRETYKVIVDSSIEQLQAYADIVAELSHPVADYQKAITGIDFDSPALDNANLPPLHDYVSEVLGLTVTDPGTSSATIAKPAEQETADAIAETTGQEVAVATSGSSDLTQTQTDELLKAIYAKLDTETTKQRDLLVTILEIGMQKVIVTDGKIATKLMFNVSGTETSQKTTAQVEQKASSWGVQGSASARWGWGKAKVSGGYQSSRLNVKAVNERTASAVNIDASMMGEVEIRFRTDSFPSQRIEE